MRGVRRAQEGRMNLLTHRLLLVKKVRIWKMNVAVVSSLVDSC